MPAVTKIATLITRGMPIVPPAATTTGPSHTIPKGTVSGWSREEQTKLYAIVGGAFAGGTILIFLGIWFCCFVGRRNQRNLHAKELARYKENRAKDDAAAAERAKDPRDYGDIFRERWLRDNPDTALKAQWAEVARLKALAQRKAQESGDTSTAVGSTPVEMGTPARVETDDAVEMATPVKMETPGEMGHSIEMEGSGPADVLTEVSLEDAAPSGKNKGRGGSRLRFMERFRKNEAEDTSHGEKA